MAPEASAYAIQSTAGRFEVLPPSAQAILGDYVAEGLNHGRRVYRRRQPTGGARQHLPEVVLFFWDSRDGKDLSGWWLGDKVGGGQVWARNPDGGTSPPQRGWRCPVDGPAQPHVQCVPRPGMQQEPGDGAAHQAPALHGRRPLEPGAAALAEAPWKRQAQPQPQASQNFVLSSALGKDAPPAVARVLGEFQHRGFNHGKRAFVKEGGGDADEGDPTVWLYYWDGRDGPDFSGWWLGRSVGGSEVYGWARQHGTTPASRGWRVPHEGPPRQDLMLVPKDHEEEAPLPEDERLTKVKELVTDAEAKAEKAVEAASSVLDGKGDLLEEGVRAACEVLQARVTDLAAAVASVGRHARAARRQGASEQADGELALLEERLQGVAQKTAEELARARQAVERVEREREEEQGAKALEERLPLAMEKVTQAELAVDAAEGGAAAAAGAAEELLRGAREEVTRSLEAAEAWAPEAQRLALAEFSALRERCGAAEERLAARILEAEANAGAGDAAEVEEADPMEEEEEAEESEEAAAAARVLLEAAVSRKRRLAAAAAAEDEEEDAGDDGVPEAVAARPQRRRRTAAVREEEVFGVDTEVDPATREQLLEAEAAVAAAEAAVRAMAEATAPLSEDNLDLPSLPPGLPEACRRAAALEPAARKACEEARETLVQKKQDPKDKACKPFRTTLKRLDERLRAAGARAAGLGRAAEEAERNWEVLKALKGELISLEARAAEAEMLNLPLGDERQPAKEVEEERAASASGTLKALALWHKRAEALADTPHVAMSSAMGRLLRRAEEARRRLGDIEAVGRQWREPALCRVFLGEVAEALDRADQAMAQAEEAEGPFLKGFEVQAMAADEASGAIEACEAAAASAEAVLAEAQSSLAARRAEAAAFRHLDAAARASTAGSMEELSTRAAALARKLGQYREDLEDRKAALGAE